MCCLTMEKRQVIKPSQFSNDAEALSGSLPIWGHCRVAPGQIIIGLEATSRYGENLYYALLKRGYRDLPVASRPSSCLRSTTRITCENRSLGLHHDRTGVAQWGTVVLELIRKRGFGPGLKRLQTCFRYKLLRGARQDGIDDTAIQQQAGITRGQVNLVLVHPASFQRANREHICRRCRVGDQVMIGRIAVLSWA